MFEVVGKHFGNRFCFKFLAIIKEFANFQLTAASAASSSALTLPASLWPLPISSIKCPKQLSTNLAEFSSKYASKFHKRKIQTIIPFLGRAIISFRGRLEFAASGIQAQALLMFNANQTQQTQEMAKNLEIRQDHLEEIMRKLVEVGVLESDGDSYKVQTNFKPNQNSNKMSFNIPSITILLMIEAHSGFQLSTTAPKDQSQKSLSTSKIHPERTSIAYNHKEHKHRV